MNFGTLRIVAHTRITRTNSHRVGGELKSPGQRETTEPHYIIFVKDGQTHIKSHYRLKIMLKIFASKECIFHTKNRGMMKNIFTK